MSYRSAAVAAIALTATLALAGCAAGTTPSNADQAGDASTSASTPVESTSAALADAGLAGLDAHELIDTLEAVPLDERATTFTASIRPSEVVVTDADQTETALPIASDEFYLSVAPYRETNHDCYFHSLTTCKGELRGVVAHVTVTDLATGEVILDEDRTTQDDGFVGLWLPKGLTATLTISVGDESASTEISTVNEDDPTCLTTLRLS